MKRSSTKYLGKMISLAHTVQMVNLLRVVS